MYTLKLNPYVSSAIWGGHKLTEKYGMKTDKENAAEAWMLSGHPNGCSVVENGEFAGMTVKELFRTNKALFGKNAEKYDEFPILIKLIDARDDLSIQVHPDDEYARRVEGESGKTECWYIVESEKDAELIIGFKDEIDRETFKTAIEDNTLLDYVNRVKVKRGDFLFIEAGTLHAIGKGILLAEVQQNSDTTYRVYDYNRVQSDGSYRTLHVDKALDVTKTVPHVSEIETNQKIESIYSSRKRMLVEGELFSVSKIEIGGKYVVRSDDSSFISMVVLTGEGGITNNGAITLVKKGDSVLIPAGSGEIIVRGALDVLETKI